MTSFEGNICFLFNIVLDDYDILVAVLIFDGDGLSRLLCVKYNKCFMIQGCVSNCDCVVTVK